MKAHLSLAERLVDMSLSNTINDLKDELFSMIELMGGFIPSKLFDAVDEVLFEKGIDGPKRDLVFMSLDWLIDQCE